MAYWSWPIRNGKTPWPSCGLSGPTNSSRKRAALPLRARQLLAAHRARSGTILPGRRGRRRSCRSGAAKSPSVISRARSISGSSPPGRRPRAGRPGYSRRGRARRNGTSRRRSARPGRPRWARRGSGPALAASGASCIGRQPLAADDRGALVGEQADQHPALVPSGSWILRQSR